MDVSVLKDYYLERGLPEERAVKAAAVLEAFQTSNQSGTPAIENCSVGLMKKYIQLLMRQNACGSEPLLALARAAFLCGNRELYIYFTQIVEREDIISNLKKHMDEILGSEKSDRIFSRLPEPATGAPPEDAVPWTQALISRMDAVLSEDECRTALTANAHGIPPEAFAKEIEFFRDSPKLETYLEESHKRSVATLQEHADSGTVWFEQIITQPVVDFVAANKEILGGVLEGNRIYWTKIPYDTKAWLEESDIDKKRYHACHCPMAREVLHKEGEVIPGKWCNCTAGFIQQRFNAIFGEAVDVDLLESVLAGDDRCRFAINIPEKFLSL